MTAKEAANISAIKPALLLTAALVVLGATPASAVEGSLSPQPKGFAGFMSGVVPPQEGLYVTDIFYYFNGSVGAEVRNGAVELGVKTTLDVDFLEGTYVTDVHILGGQYAFGGAIGWAWADLSATVETPLGNRHVKLASNGFADSLIIPAVLGWHSGAFNWSIALPVYMPTGQYNLHQLSVGKNIWAFLPTFAITYFDPASGWDVSGNFVYVTQGNNSATDYQSGDLIQLDWAVGMHFGEKEAWEAGVTGNVVQQIGADSGSGAKLGPFKAQSFGLGPSISYTGAIGSTPVSFSAKWEHDLDTHNTFKGDVATVSLTAVF